MENTQCVTAGQQLIGGAIVEAEGRKRGLYRSDDHGDTWTKTSSKPELAWRPWYYMHVYAHPTDPNTVWVLDMKAWKSIDGGNEFTEFDMPHGDTHDLWIDPKDPDSADDVQILEFPRFNGQFSYAANAAICAFSSKSIGVA